MRYFRETLERTFRVQYLAERGVAVDGSGLKAAVFEYRGEGGPTVLAFMGTTGLRDMVDNVEQGLLPGDEFGFGGQYDAAGRLAESVIQSEGVDVFVGHSLGGGLAQYASLLTGAPAVTVNAAPLNPHTELHARQVAARRGVRGQRNIVNYSVAGDPISEGIPSIDPSGSRLVGETRHIPRAPETRVGFPRSHARPTFPTMTGVPSHDNARIGKYYVDRVLHPIRQAAVGLGFIKDVVGWRARETFDAHRVAEALEEYARFARAGGTWE